MDLPQSMPPTPELESVLHTPISEREIDLRHPTPDLQSLQGAYVGNIERLEDEAERMSTSGSELGDEIRKLQLEQKLSDSRKSSLRSGPSELPRSTRSRNVSTSSHANSILDVNTAARWGGYSPAGYITSPLGSVHSGSWPANRQRSASRASRLGQMSHPDLKEEGQLGLNDFPQPPVLKSPPIPSITRQFDEGDEIDTGVAPGYFSQKSSLGLHVVSDEVEHNPNTLSPDVESPGRPGSAGSGDTYQQANILFRDFDGIHFEPDDFAVGRVTGQDAGSRQSSGQGSQDRQRPRHGRSSSGHSLLNVLDRPPAGVPPPSDDMVFYPAPVPRMLNLPKRLSQLPTTSVQAKRRTQVLSTIPADARKSAVWLSGDMKSPDNSIPPVGSPGEAPKSSSETRRSMMNLTNLPPQLRASAYFDHQPVPHNADVKGGSAMDALDHILEASTSAPVSAFTDHPYSGYLGNEVYGKEAVRKSTLGLPDSPKKDRKSRSSMLVRRKSSLEGPNKLRKRSNSRLSIALSEQLHVDEDVVHSDEEGKMAERNSLHDIETEEHPTNEKEEIEQEEHDLDHPTYSGPPTTLLAELQIRKAQQKTRNRTAATAFPNGMHSTLLQLDAVAQIEKDKRRTHKVNLAWEEYGARAAEKGDESDEDVPLGMLYPGRDGLANKGSSNAPRRGQGDRPIGLIEQRQMEDNEPLSKRRTRLMGIEPERPHSHRQSIPLSAVQNADQVRASTPIEPKEEKEGEEEGETLAQRLRRLRNKAALDGAVEDVQERPVSQSFANEMLSQLGSTADADEKPVPEEEETLGQRRKRLQAEALARGNTHSDLNIPHLDVPGAAQTRPPLRASHSMADILAMHPANHQARKVSNDQLLDSLPQGSLLQQSEATRARHKKHLLDSNRRVSGKPLVDISQIREKDWDTPLGLLGAHDQAQAKRHTSLMPHMTPNHHMSMSTPNLMAPNGYQMGGMMNPMQFQMQQQMMNQQIMNQQMMNPMQIQMQMQMQQQWQMMNGGVFQQPQQMMPMNGMGGGGMTQDQGSGDTNSMVDRWRHGVA